MALDESQGIADEGEEITPADGADAAFRPSVLYVGTSGTLRIRDTKGNVINYVNIFGGTWLPILVTRVHDAGTTCTGIVRHF